MAKSKDITSPKKGMNRDKASFDLTQTEYSFMLNGNFHDEHGTGEINLQNEPSNIYCSGFKDGFKVIGHKFDINRDVTYFFLTNPTTGCSEIGYISSFSNIDGLEQMEKECDCNITVILENPLEDQLQEAICEYNTIISDYCEATETCGCLGFSVNHPIDESDIQLKDEASGRVLYWTDGINPPRYLQLDRIEDYFKEEDPCTDEVVDTCLNCDELRIWKLFNKPCIKVDSIQNGGNLRAGTYEVLIAYSSQTGEEITDYYALTNPIPVFDENNNILDQTNLDYLTNQAIRIAVEDTDEDYEFFKIAVLYRSGLDGALSGFSYGVYPITASSVIISSLLDKETLPINDILNRRVSYLTSDGLSSGNGYLFHYGMEAHRVVNLQPVVSLMGLFAKWATVQANEDLYENGVNVSKYLSNMRDEVVPYSIKFIFDGGYETPNFLFVPRPPRPEEIEEIGVGYPEDDNNQSILTYSPDCSGNERTKRWQFENTAKVLGRCEVPAGITESEVTSIVDEEVSCVLTEPNGDITVVDTVPAGVVPSGTNNDLVTYINENKDAIISSIDPAWADIINVLTGTYPGDCTPAFGDNCDTPVFESEEILAVDVETVTTSEISIPFNEYNNHPLPPSNCFLYAPDGTNPSNDTAFETTYMRSGEIVYNRLPAGSNTNCINANLVPTFTTPQLDNSFFLQYDGSLESVGGISNLQDSRLVSAINLGLGYTDKLHTNAQWYRIEFNGLENIGLEISPSSTLNNLDDICRDTLRISVFTDCSDPNDIPAYGTIITDTALVNDPNKLIVLDSADFGGITGVAYIAIDSSINTDVDWTVTLSETGTGAAPGDSFDIVIDGTSYSVVFDTDLTTTASNFVSTHAATILASHDTIVTSNVDVIEFRSTEAIYDTVVLNNITGDLNGTLDFTEKYHTLRPPCGCVNIYNRQVELETVTTFTNLTFGKRQVWTASCEYTIPDLKNCDAVPYEFGDFSYWESVETYPCNDELWDSSRLDKIDPNTLSGLDAIDLAFFESEYTNGVGIDGYYDMSVGSDFRNKPIRHYKYPCSIISPFMSTTGQNPGAFKDSIIYPIGFSIDNDVIRKFLDVAVENGLLTLEERLKIKSYEIFRGDRSVDKSVIAKGLLFDMYQYSDPDIEQAYYPNYPLNSLGSDKLNGGINHRFGSYKNNLFTFHSPDTHFYKPTLPAEMKVEGYQFGKSNIVFDVVRDHPEYVILGDAAYGVATALAITEVTLDLAVQGLGYYLEASAAGTVPGVALSIAIATGIAIALVGGIFKVGELRYQWIETFRNLGQTKQFAYYSVAVGHYNYFLPNPSADNVLRGLASRTYLKEGRWRVADEVAGTNFNVNNVDREQSVFLNLGSSYFLNYPSQYYSYDNRTFNPLFSSRTGDAINSGEGEGYKGTGKSPSIVKNAASPYVSLKQYLPAQYGNVQAINWIHTGFCGKLEENLGCNPIFGGDTYISRFSLKRKFPFFTANSHGLAPRTPFEYSDYFNVYPTYEFNRFYVDYLTNDDDDNFFMLFVFPANRSKFNLDISSGTGGFYIKPPAKFYLYSYGIPYFLVESVINNNYRYAKRERQENFYPNIGDVIEFTQESNVSIREPNTFFYNFVYSGLPSRYPWSMLPDNYDEELYAGLQDLENTTIYSRQDSSDASLTDPWLLYRALDTYTFPKAFGKLIDMDNIESEAILARFENGFTVFGAIDQLADRLTPDTKNIGTGGIFAGRSIDFNKTDLGYAGTQHKAKVSCEFGHFWCDAKRGQVFLLAPNASGLQEITEGVSKWFKEHLPFKISAYVKGLTQEALDNAYKGLGITMGWDSRLKRVFLTKLDYKAVRSDIDYQYDEVGFFYLDNESNRIDIELTDTEFFEDCSFTIAYSPLTATWISYYSFKPNYYISYNNYFQTGKNYSVDASEIGLWSHLPFLSSYQVFYGKLYPWIVENALLTKFTNSVLESVEYWLDVRKYYNKYDFSNVFGYGFNKAYIYNNQQNSGQLNLFHQKNNDLSQAINYPKFNVDSIDILQSEINGKWSFNFFYNLIKNERAGLPIWRHDCNQIEKTLDSRLLDYRSSYKDRMRGDYFLLRLQQDAESRYKMILRFNADQREYYDQ